MKKKTKKFNPYTEQKNAEPPVKVEEVKVIGEVELPETKSIAPIKKFAMPIATPEQLKEAMEKYQQCVNALIKSNDIVMIEGKPHGKKIAINKICRVFGVSSEVVRSFQEEHVADKDYCVYSRKEKRNICLVKKGEKYIVAKAWVKAILPNGQFCTRGGAVSETERRFTHYPHDLIATAETRALKNAAINLLGIEFEMIEEDEEMLTPKESIAQAQKEEQIEEYEFEGKKYIRRIQITETGKQIIEEGIDPNRWIPMFNVSVRRQMAGKGYSDNWNKPPTQKQLEVIKTALEKIEIKPENAIFKLNNRADRKIREKRLEHLDYGDAWDLCEIIIKKGKEAFQEVVTEVVPVK